MKDFRELQVWQKSHQLTLEVYPLTQSFSKEELYGLTSQMRRSAASVAANLAEGCNRGGDREFAHFCHIAMGSASELEYFVVLASDLKLLEPTTSKALTQGVTEVKKMLASLIKKLTAEC